VRYLRDRALRAVDEETDASAHAAGRDLDHGAVLVAMRGALEVMTAKGP